jgi:hypothetical protein
MDVNVAFQQLQAQFLGAIRGNGPDHVAPLQVQWQWIGRNAAPAHEAPPPRPIARPVTQPIAGNDAPLLVPVQPLRMPVRSIAALQPRGYGVNVGNIADGRQHNDDNDDLLPVDLGPRRRQQGTQQVPEPRLRSLRPRSARRPDA